VYARTVGDKTLTFVNSGMLWVRRGGPPVEDGHTVVLNDLETMSEWPHALGTAVRGPLKGTTLKKIASAMVTWKRWKTDNPDTTVSILPRSGTEYTPDFYAPVQKFVVGVMHGDAAVAYSLPLLKERTVINDTLGSEPIVVVYDRAGYGAAAYRRTLKGKVLKFTSDNGQLFAGGSHWHNLTGQALDGPLQGERLEPINAIISFAVGWRRYHPEAKIVGEK
jgi:hypothetical protein